MMERVTKNTHKPTPTVIKLINNYLADKKLGTIDEILNEDLPNILLDFYTKWQTKKKDFITFRA